MTVGELRESLENLDSQLRVEIAFDGSFVPVVEVALFESTDFVLLRGKAKNPPKKFTIQEQGLIGHLHRLGFDNDRIGEVLGRSADSVKKERKKLGF